MEHHMCACWHATHELGVRHERRPAAPASALRPARSAGSKVVPQLPQCRSRIICSKTAHSRRTQHPSLHPPTPTLFSGARAATRTFAAPGRVAAALWPCWHGTASGVSLTGRCRCPAAASLRGLGGLTRLVTWPALSRCPAPRVQAPPSSGESFERGAGQEGQSDRHGAAHVFLHGPRGPGTAAGGPRVQGPAAGGAGRGGVEQGRGSAAGRGGSSTQARTREAHRNGTPSLLPPCQDAFDEAAGAKHEAACVQAMEDVYGACDARFREKVSLDGHVGCVFERCVHCLLPGRTRCGRANRRMRVAGSEHVLCPRAGPPTAMAL